MDCNKTSWDAYSEDSSEEESKQTESPLIIDAKINLFLRRYNSCPLEKEELIEVFVQSNFDESTIDLVINKKLIEQQKIKNNLLKSEKNKKTEEENKKNQSKDSWKEAKQNTSNNTNNNQKYKKSKYNKNHNSNYNNSNYNQNNNHSSRYYYQNKKHYKKNYKSYKHQKNNYIEREIEFNSKNELDNNNNEVNEDNFVEKNNMSLSPEFSADSNSKNSKENTEENSTINNLELLNLNLSKSQSEELNHKNYDLNEVGIKLFPGIYKSKKFNFEFDKNCSSINNINKTDFINKNINNYEEDNKKVEDMDNSLEKNNCIKNKNDFKQNFLHKANSCMNRPQQKDGLALAFDYYSSFLEDTKK